MDATRLKELCIRPADVGTEVPTTRAVLYHGKGCEAHGCSGINRSSSCNFYETCPHDCQ